MHKNVKFLKIHQSDLIESLCQLIFSLKNGGMNIMFFCFSLMLLLMGKLFVFLLVESQPSNGLLLPEFG